MTSIIIIIIIVVIISLLFYSPGFINQEVILGLLTFKPLSSLLLLPFPFSSCLVCLHQNQSVAGEVAQTHSFLLVSLVSHVRGKESKPLT